MYNKPTLAATALPDTLPAAARGLSEAGLKHRELGFQEGGQADGIPGPRRRTVPLTRAQGPHGPWPSTNETATVAESVAGSGHVDSVLHRAVGPSLLPSGTLSPRLISSSHLPKNLISLYFNPKQMIQQFLSLFTAPCLGGFSEGPSGPRGEKGRGCWIRAGATGPSSRSGGRMGTRERQTRGGLAAGLPPFPHPISGSFILVKTVGTGVLSDDKASTVP